MSLLSTQWEKEELLRMSEFSFSQFVLYHFGKLSTIFIKFKIIVCKLFQFGRVQNMSFRTGLILPSVKWQRFRPVQIESICRQQMKCYPKTKNVSFDRKHCRIFFFIHNFLKNLILQGCLTHYQTTNFRLFQIERLQTTISNLTKMAESYSNR